jgi:hypothetical protein
MTELLIEHCLPMALPTTGRENALRPIPRLNAV